MKNLVFLIFAAFTLNVSAGEIQLKKFVEYTVPKGKVWVFKGVEPADCKVCTSDLRVDGGISVGATSELTMYGKFDMNFNKKKHNEIHLFSGTKFWLGDSRPELKATEVNE